MGAAEGRPSAAFFFVRGVAGRYQGLQIALRYVSYNGMSLLPAPASLIATAPDLARRIGVIMALLVARVLLRQPKDVALIVPLWQRLGRIAGRVERVLTRPSRPRRRAPAPPRAAPIGPQIPRGRGWLRAALGPDAGGYASQLCHLLNQPEFQAAMLACPAMVRVLRPVLWMLGPELVAPAPPGAPPPPPPRVWPRPARVPVPARSVVPAGSGFDWAAALRGPEKSRSG